VLLSDWHRQFWKQYGFDNKVSVVPDGVELSRFKKRDNISYGNFVYSSSWDRGLDNVITILDEVRKKTKLNITLDVMYGNDNLLKVARQYGYKWLEDFNNQILKEIESRSWIKVHGRVDQNTLSNNFSNAFVWLYPTYFQETCCITALEAMAAGLPLIHNGFAGLERFNNVGIYIPCQMGSRLINGFNKFDPFIDMTVELLSNPDLWKRLSIKSLSEVQKYTWQNIVKEQWIPLIESM
jgi:glycosyltransferase involved in cell wall biosynthesis